MTEGNRVGLYVAQSHTPTEAPFTKAIGTHGEEVLDHLAVSSRCLHQIVVELVTVTIAGQWLVAL